MSDVDPSLGGIDVVHVDLAAGPPEPPPGSSPAFVVCWWRHVPIGQLLVRRGPRPNRAVWANEIAKAVAPAVANRLQHDLQPPRLPGGVTASHGDEVGVAALAAGGSPLGALDRLQPFGPAHGSADRLSVVVCTRGRPTSLRSTLHALETQVSPPAEVIVVDNDPADERTRKVVDECMPTFSGLRYVAEPHPGLSIARNTGLRAATGELIAFTDDDALPHPMWSAQMCRVFDDMPGVSAVTGLVLPASLDSPAAALFELNVGGFGQGYLPRLYESAWFRATRWRGAPVWQVGAGANMGFRRETFDLVGGFDERLGAGAAGCSEDSELWYRLLAAGHRCRYEPAVVVTHHHRGDVDALRAQSTDYIEGHVAALFVQYARHRHPGELVRAVGIMPRHVLLRLLHARRKGTLTAWEELRGYLRGLRHAGYARRAAAAPDVSPDVVGARPSQQVSPSPPAHRRSFLRANPYGRPYTDGLFFREKMRAIHHVTADHPAAAVLEIGGGRSGLTASLYPGASVITVDVDTTYGAEAINASARRRFVGADATSLPFDGGLFDAVTLFDVVEHIDDDSGAIAEALRVLRPGGRLLLTTPSSSWRFPYFRAFRRICPTDAEVMADWGHVRRGYSVAELDRIVGHRHDLAATFISPVTVLAHDVSFSNLGRVARRAAATLVAPVAWIGYAAHRPHHEGNEIAVAWTKRG